MGDSRVVIDRRGFLELAAASSVVAATGVVAAGCQGPPGATPPVPAVPPVPPSVAEVVFAAPLRTAVVPDDVPPAFAFQPLAQPR
jgi:hypothetical protein